MEQYLEKAQEIIERHSYFNDSIRKLIENWEIHYKEQISNELAKNILITCWTSLENKKELYIGNKQTLKNFVDFYQAKQYQFHYKSYNGIKKLLLSYIAFMNVTIDYYLFYKRDIRLFLHTVENLDSDKKLIFTGETPTQSEITLAAKHFADQRVMFSTEIDSNGFQAQQLHDFWLINFKKHVNEFNIGLIDWHILYYLSEEVAQKCKENSILINKFNHSKIARICSDIFIKYPSKTTPKNLIAITRYNYPEICFMHSSEQEYYLEYIKYLQKSNLLTLSNFTTSQQKIQDDWKLLFDKGIPLNTAKYILATLWYQYPECFEEYSKIFLKFQDIYLTSDIRTNQYNRSIFLTNKLNELEQKFPLYTQEQIIELKSHLFKNKLNVENIQMLHSFWSDLFQQMLIETQAQQIFKHLKEECFVIGSPNTKQFIFIQHLKETSQIISLDLDGYKLAQKIWKKLFNTNVPISLIRNKLQDMKWICSLHFTYGKNDKIYSLIEYIISESILIDNGPSGFKEFQALLSSKQTYKKLTIKESKKLFNAIKKLYPECLTGKIDLSDHTILINIDAKRRKELLAIFAQFCQKNKIVFSQENVNIDLFQKTWEKCFESYSKCNNGN